MLLPAVRTAYLFSIGELRRPRGRARRPHLLVGRVGDGDPADGLGGYAGGDDLPLAGDGRRGFNALETLGYNFNLAILDVGYPPAWQVLAFGLLAALGAAGRKAHHLRAP